MSGSIIRDLYTDQTVLITGVTGFLGKVLIEKVSVAQVCRIYFHVPFITGR